MRSMTRKRFSVIEMAAMMAVTLFCVTVVSYAVSIPHTFVNGTVADADEVNANFQALVNAVNALEAQVAAQQEILQYVQLETGELNGLAGPHVIFEAVNVHVESGSGATDGTINGLGNLVIGYNEDSAVPRDRTGSHNLVVGERHAYPSFGGLVAGAGNTISGEYASVIGGQYNKASGYYSSVSGGYFNEAIGQTSSVSGGGDNEASGTSSSVSGGQYNKASGYCSSVAGGGSASDLSGNEAFANHSAILGGSSNLTGDPDLVNHTMGMQSTVSGGNSNVASGYHSSVSGGEFNDATNYYSSVSGGAYNEAGGQSSSVSGGWSNDAAVAYSHVLGDSGKVYVDTTVVH